MKKTVLRKYAQLIAKCGVNIQKGQEVIIGCDLDQPEFIQILVDECYKAGAGKVIVDWSYQPLAKLHYRYRSMKTLTTLEKWELERWQHYVDKIPCRIYIESADPDGLKGINQHKVAESRKALYPIIKPFRDKLENKYQWCIAAVRGVLHIPNARQGRWYRICNQAAWLPKPAHRELLDPLQGRQGSGMGRREEQGPSYQNDHHGRRCIIPWGVRTGSI